MMMVMMVIQHIVAFPDRLGGVTMSAQINHFIQASARPKAIALRVMSTPQIPL
jgi:hypothetical protein